MVLLHHRAELNPAAIRCTSPVMGVPGFLTWLEGSLPEALVQVRLENAPRHADVLAFDLNSLLHDALRNARDEEQATLRVFQSLHHCMKQVRPHSTVLLALDGAAPLAKMETQRKRRAKASGKAARARGLSGLCATPGTRFMARMEDALACVTRFSIALDPWSLLPSACIRFGSC